MDHDTDRIEHLVGCVALAAGETLRLDDPRAVLVYVAQGTVWITEEANADDVVLRAEGHFRLSRPGAALVEALAPVILFLTAPSETGYAARVTTIPAPRAATAVRRRPQPVAAPRLAAARP